MNEKSHIVATTMCGMSDKVRKRLVWMIKKGLYRLTAEEIFRLTQSIEPVEDLNQISWTKRMSSFDYLSAYMPSNPLLMSEDEGVSWLLHL